MAPATALAICGEASAPGSQVAGTTRAPRATLPRSSSTCASASGEGRTSDIDRHQRPSALPARYFGAMFGGSADVTVAVPSATLYVIGASHACRTGMLMLEHKGIAYRRVDLLTGPHPLSVRIRGF